MGRLLGFSMIAESGSMIRASSRLFMTQFAISMQIKRLGNVIFIVLFGKLVAAAIIDHFGLLNVPKAPITTARIAFGQ